MTSKEQWLWALILTLTRHYDFQVMQIPEKLKLSAASAEQAFENLMLIRNEGRQYHMLRIQGLDYIWGSTLMRDIRSFADQIPVLRSKLRAKHLDVRNVYLLTSPEDLSITERISALRVIEENKMRMINAVIYHPSELYHPPSLPLNVDQPRPFNSSDLQKLMQEIEALQLENWGISSQEVYHYIFQYADVYTLEQLRAEVKKEDKKKEEQFNRIFFYGKPMMTIAFLVINAVVFLLLEYVGSSTDPETLIQYGAKWNPSILQGEYWRLMTPMFLHIGLIHMGLNSLALYFLGSLVERVYGSFRFLWIYLFAGFAGTLASFAFNANLAAGASGAIFGCFGAMLYFGLQYRNLFFRTLGMDIIFILIFNLAIGFIFPMIDNFGHIGGLIGGFLAAAMLNLPHKQRLWDQVASTLVATITVLAFIYYGFTYAEDSPQFYLYQAEIQIRQEDFVYAKANVEKAIELGLKEPDVYLQLGMVYNQLEMFREAKEVLLKSKELGGDRAELYFYLSYAQLQLREYEKGKEHLLETIYRQPEMMEAYYNLAYLHALLEEWSEAQEVISKAKQRGIEHEKLDELEQKIKEQNVSAPTEI